MTVPGPNDVAAQSKLPWTSTGAWRPVAFHANRVEARCGMSIRSDSTAAHRRRSASWRERAAEIAVLPRSVGAPSVGKCQSPITNAAESLRWDRCRRCAARSAIVPLGSAKLCTLVSSITYDGPWTSTPMTRPGKKCFTSYATPAKAARLKIEKTPPAPRSSQADQSEACDAVMRWEINSNSEPCVSCKGTTSCWTQRRRRPSSGMWRDRAAVPCCAGEC